jgi:hypothetical protein
MITEKELIRRLDAIESEGAIRRLMAAYLHARDVQQSGRQVAALFTPDGIWEALGSLAEVLGRHQGCEAVEQRTDVSVRQLTFSAHFLTNESITVDGDTAVGSWAFLQTGINKGRAVWIAGRYRNDFLRSNGAWRIHHLRVESYFATPYEDGWAKTPFAQ